VGVRISRVVGIPEIWAQISGMSPLLGALPYKATNLGTTSPRTYGSL